MSMPAERFYESRHVDPDAIAIQPGFRIEAVSRELDNPSSLDFDEEGNIFVAEMGSPDASAYRPGKVIRIRPDGSTAVVASDFWGSLTGIAYYEGSFFVAEHSLASRIYRIFEDGEREIIVDGIPGGGDHPTSDVVVAHSERIYFGQGTRTNAGIVGADNEWLTEHPEICDVPGRDITLAGKNYESENVFGPGKVKTGAFKLYGVESAEGEKIKGSVKSSGSIMRVDPDGGELEVFAWGLRNPVGMSVHADGRIFCADTGMEDRGVRRVNDGSSYFWRIVEDGWYGWPDYTGGEPVTDGKFAPKDGILAEPLLKDPPHMAGKPIAKFTPGSGIGHFDFSRSHIFGEDNIAFVPLMGESQCKVVTIDIADGEIEDFAFNKIPGPSSKSHSGGFEHPISAKFDRTGEILYILDLGIIDPSAGKSFPRTGVLWKITPEFYSREEFR